MQILILVNCSNDKLPLPTIPSGEERFENLNKAMYNLVNPILDNAEHKLTGAVQLNHSNDNVENINLGIEYWWNRVFALRGGYATAKVEQDFSVGFGLNLSLSLADFALDYSYSNFGRLGYVNRFGAHIKF